MNRALIIQQNPIEVKSNDTWVLVFRHNSSNKDFFRNEKEALFSAKKNKYSLLGRIDDNFMIDGRYEFILEYPQINKFYHWTQTKNPIKAGPYDDIGFEPKSIDYGDLTGLARCSNSKAFLDGNVGHEYWYFAIGAYSSYNSMRCFPGPYNGNETFCFNSVSLYMKVNETKYLERLLSYNLCSRRNNGRLSMYFIVMIFFVLNY